MKYHKRLVALALVAFGYVAPFTEAQTFEESPIIMPDSAAAEELREWDAEVVRRPATDMDAIDAAHVSYLRNTELQLVRPESDFQPAARVPAPGWLRVIGRFMESLGPIFRWVFYAAVAAVVCGVLYFLYGEAIRMRLGLGNRRNRAGGDDHLIDLRPDAARAKSLLEEADALARTGRFAEAVHLLLFRSIEDIQNKVDGGVPKSLTAREIAGFERLPVRERTALEPIIRIVEQSFFGGRSVDRDGWVSARASYEDFAFGGVSA